MRLSIVAALVNDNLVKVDNDDVLLMSQVERNHFDNLTKGGWLLYGRETVDRGIRTLGQRKNLTLTSNSDYVGTGGFNFSDLNSAITYASDRGASELFIVGGMSLFSQYINTVDRLYLNVINLNYDVTGEKFPDLDMAEWNLNSELITEDERLNAFVTFEVYDKVV